MKWRLAFLCLLTAACSEESGRSPTFYSNENPEHLSDWGMIASHDGALSLSEGVTPYDLATPLFSDYALKLRTLWTPEGAPAMYDPENAFDFPVGTVITKTFYYPDPAGDDNSVAMGDPPPMIDGTMTLAGYRLMETRILVRRAEGWTALPYVWNDEQTDAQLKRAGAVLPFTLTRSDGRAENFHYLVPNANQCAGCHATNATTKAIQPIGMKARHLNKTSTYQPAFNQLDYWIASGLLDGSGNTQAPSNADWSDEAAPLDARARAYLDINCSHCHNPNGPADTSGLNLEPDTHGPAVGFCKSPIAAGGGTGGRAYDIVPGDPDASITLYRMESTDPGDMMPELGRALVHEEGIALIARWISEMPGDCG